MQIQFFIVTERFRWIGVGKEPDQPPAFAWQLCLGMQIYQAEVALLPHRHLRRHSHLKHPPP